MINLKIIIASTRPGRKGPLFANWIYELARAVPELSTELVDLAVINLPFMDEPNHPRMGQYIHQHTKDWSAKIAEADAFILVTPEYNYGFPATIKNAIDFLFNEWKHKPIAFLSYGGVAAGTRSIQMLKLTLTALEMVPLSTAINIPFYTNHIKEDVFVPTEEHKKTAAAMFQELLKWSKALELVRKPPAV